MAVSWHDTAGILAPRGRALVRAALLSLLVPIALGVAPTASASTEEDVREQIKAGAAHLLEQGDLSEYDREASALRDSHELTPGASGSSTSSIRALITSPRMLHTPGCGRA